ncbi:GerW family sporulation protein [Massiliimalia massiliensis]|jgi:sporulation protein YtfJ|uniref:GerW family sporulation protein n=1 Tax=Massiliimalia massiliensis TaxID=1852384 RepID=UPI0009858740|nr:GerW family sporulation protein [Massiliimalia massiliensis]MBS1473720.1 sporulation protein YtfJ [Massiliimalia sp.]
MSEHPIQGMMSTTMQKIREMVDVNTIVGEPITSPDGTIIIPVSKVSFGFASGGSDIPSKQPKDIFGGASGAGVSIQPLAFLVVYQGNVKLLQMTNDENTANNVVNMVPEVIDKISELFKKEKTGKPEKQETVEE